MKKKVGDPWRSQWTCKDKTRLDSKQKKKIIIHAEVMENQLYKIRNISKCDSFIFLYKLVASVLHLNKKKE